MSDKPTISIRIRSKVRGPQRAHHDRLHTGRFVIFGEPELINDGVELGIDDGERTGTVNLSYDLVVELNTFLARELERRSKGG